MKTNIITISREFGSGGHTIAQSVAAQLGVPCYDKAFVEQVAQQSGFTPAYIEKQGEEAVFPFFRTGTSGAPDAMNGMNADDYLWCVQRQTVLELAAKGPCVLVGRCADFILQDRQDVLNVFICADKAYRAVRIVQRYGETQQPAQQRLHRKDKQRRAYYRYYTDREWGTPQNYALCLNSSLIGESRCAEIIVEEARR